MSRLAVPVLLLAAVLRAPAALADCPLPGAASSALAKLDDQARIDFIRESLSRDAADTRIWNALWVAANGGLLMGTGGLAPFYPAKNQITLFVGIGATATAALPLVLLPPSIMRDGPAYSRLVLHGNVDPCKLIRLGEQTMLHIAIEEAATGGWLPQTINVLYNVGVGLILIFAVKQWQAGISAMFSGTAIGEAVMITQPKEMPKDLQRYLQGDVDHGTAGPQFGFQLRAEGTLLKLSF